MKKHLLVILFLISSLVLGLTGTGRNVSARANPEVISECASHTAAAAAPDLEMKEVMIPMRDGVRLHTNIFTPKHSSEALPFLMSRTPYGIPGAVPPSLQELAAEGYIFVFQDIRGRYKSEGQFVMLRPVRDKNDPNSIDEGSDTYDTVEWLLKNVPHNNGRAGILGISYGGWTTVMGIIDPHPAMKAASEQATCADMFIGDDFHHNGAFRLAYGFEYVSGMELSKELTPFKFDTYDSYDWYLRLGTLSAINQKHLNDRSPTWNNFVSHPNYDAFWQKQAVAQYLSEIRVPNLNVAGWFDQEDFYGPMKVYDTVRKHDPNHLNYLIVGPWNHGGWAHGDGKMLGKIDFGSETSRYFREHVQSAWFAYWLKDKGAMNQPHVLAFQTGSNQWKEYEEWPPSGAAMRNLYLHPGGKLSFEAPREADLNGFDSYVSDPARPVPYQNRPIPPMFAGPGWTTWLADDQRFVHLRPDVLSWETEPLKEPVTISGEVMAKLFASTSGTDSDWVVKLIDVYPDTVSDRPEMSGYQFMVADEVLRARYRDGFEQPKPLLPNKVTAYKLDLHTHSHSFLPGHRIMVQVQSTWFPLIDRNPQKFVPNIYKAAASDYQKATQRVYRSKRWASSIEMPIETSRP